MKNHYCFCSIAQACLTLQTNGLQHTRLLSPSPGASSNSYPLSRWCHPTILSSIVPFFSCLQSFSAKWYFSNESALHISWPKCLRFSISPSNEYSGLISFRIDRFNVLAAQGALESSATPQFKSTNSSALGFLYGPTLTSIHDYWKDHSLNYTGLCQQSDVFAF